MILPRRARAIAHAHATDTAAPLYRFAITGAVSPQCAVDARIARATQKRIHKAALKELDSLIEFLEHSSIDATPGVTAHA